MEQSELESLLIDLESDRSERKPSIANTDKIRQAICDFANDIADHRRPGVIFVVEPNHVLALVRRGV